MQYQNLLNVLHILPCSAFYEKEAMLMDPVDGPILASLLGIYDLHLPMHGLNQNSQTLCFASL